MFFTKEQWERIAQDQAEIDAANRQSEKVVWEHQPRRTRYEIQAHYGTGWQRFAPDKQLRYFRQDTAIERAEHLASRLPHRPFRVVEVEL